MKKAISLFLAAVLCVSLVACSGSNNNPKEMSVEDYIKKAEENIAKVKSMDAQMQMDMGLNMLGQTLSAKTDATIITFNEPVKMKMEMNMDMGEVGKQSMSMYAEEKDGQLTMYLYDGSSWTKQAMDISAIEQYDAQGNMDLYLKNSTSFVLNGEETIGEYTAVRLDGLVTGDSLSEVINASGVLDSMSGLVDEDTLSAMYSELGDLPISIWVDKQNLYPVKYEMDMTNLMQKVFDNIIEMSGQTLPEGQELKVDVVKVSMTCSNFDKATDFTIPEEALAA